MDKFHKNIVSASQFIPLVLMFVPVTMMSDTFDVLTKSTVECTPSGQAHANRSKQSGRNVVKEKRGNTRNAMRNAHAIPR